MNKEILITINGTDNQSINIPLSKLSHTIIFGNAGSGKSNLLHMLILNLTKNYSPDNLKIALIDPKCVEFNSYKSLPNLFSSLARTPEEIISLLSECETQINNNTPIIIVIDELAELIFDNDITSKIISMLNNDKNSNIYFIAATQSPNSIPEEIFNNTKTQISFPIESNKLSKELLKEFDNNQIKKSGEMLFVNEKTKIHFHTIYISQSLN